MSLANNFFSEINTEGKAYFLGWIAAKGIINRQSVEVQVAYQQVRMLELLRSIIDKELPIGEVENTSTGRQVYLPLDSPQIAQDVCKWLQLDNENYALSETKLPLMEDSFLQWSFIRGLFDANSTLNTENVACTLKTSSREMLTAVKEFGKIPAAILQENQICSLSLHNNNALDFLGNLYDQATYASKQNKEVYIALCTYIPGLNDITRQQALNFTWVKASDNAVPPFKERVSDSGYDLTLIDKVKQVGDVTFFDTGIKIQPGYGWYFDLVPRSSISKTGYMLANNVGVIDRTYTGNVLVPLIKIDKNMPELNLPARVVQIIPRPIIHVQWQQVETFEETARGAGGFGSTGK